MVAGPRGFRSGAGSSGYAVPARRNGHCRTRTKDPEFEVTLKRASRQDGAPGAAGRRVMDRTIDPTKIATITANEIPIGR